MKNFKKVLCVVFSLLMIVGSVSIIASAEEEELYNLVILEDSYFTKELAYTALTVANVSDPITLNAICQNLDIRANFPGVLAPKLTKENADAAVTALKNAGYNNCAAAKMKMGENITWTMKDAKITLTGSGETYVFDDNKNSTPLECIRRWEIDKDGNIVKGEDGFNKPITGNTSGFSIEVGEGITVLNKYTFRYVAMLTGDPQVSSIGPSVTLPSTLTTIGSMVFAFSEAKSINIPESVTFIGDGAFWQTKLGNVSIPKNTKLEGNVFANSGVTAFSLDSDNPYYSLRDGILYSKDGKTLIAYPEKKVSSEIKVLNGVNTLGASAFYGAEITKVILPESTEVIGDACFYSSTLKEIYIASGLKTIGKAAFKTGTYGVNGVSYSYFTTAYYEKGTDIDSIKVGTNNGPYENAEKIEVSSYPQSTTYMVSFVCGNADSAPAFVMVNSGSTVSKPADPVASGNKFLGWYADSNYTKTFDFSKAITGNTTVYAKWENDISKTVTKIKADTLYAKTEFNKGDSFSTNGLTLTVTYSDGTTETITSGFTTTNPNMNSTGQQTITVTYGGCTTNYYISIKEGSGQSGTNTETKNVTLPEKSSSYKNNVVIEVTCSADYITVNGTRCDIKNGKASYNMNQLKADKDVVIEVFSSNNLITSAKGTIKVPNSFGNKISAFFSYIFNGFTYKTTTVAYTL